MPEILVPVLGGCVTEDKYSAVPSAVFLSLNKAI